MRHVIKEVLNLEGGYVNDPHDSGGETKYGITQRTAFNSGYTGSMEDLTIEDAEEIYKKLYWEPLQGNRLYVLSPPVSKEVFDTSVNIGIRRASIFLQKSLNVLYPQSNPLIEDGILGEKTLEALKGYLNKRDELTLVKALNCLQGAFYIELAEKRKKDTKFIYGWLKNRVKL